MAEGVVRVGWPQPLDPPEVPLLRGSFVTPGLHPYRTPEFDVTVSVNADGFVDRAWDEPADVVVIGDSFVQAAQVPMEQGFGRQLEALLGRKVRSMGVPGAGTATALELLQERALPGRPGAVVLGFLVGNDVLNNSPTLDPKGDKRFFDVVGGKLVAVEAASAGLTQRGGLWEWSALWRGAHRAWVRQNMVTDLVARGQGVPVDFRVYDPEMSPAWADAWRVTEALIGEMAARCAQADVRFGVVLFPDAVAGSASGEARLVADWPMTAGWDVSAPHGRAERMVAGLGVPVLDLRAALRAVPDAYYPVDGHWTPAGHAGAARAAAPWTAQLLTQRHR